TGIRSLRHTGWHGPAFDKTNQYSGVKPFISFAIKKYTIPSKDRGSPWWGWLRAGFTPEYSLN
ncbi:hypothetical protein AADO69_25010, partial [Escherichia coli]